MHVRRLVELAGIMAYRGPVLIGSGVRLSADSLEQYWTTSKVRLDRWARALKQFSQDANLDAKRRQRLWPATRGVLEEILASEMLTRVWAAVLSACDEQRGADEVEPIARSVMIGHMEARHRVLTLMVRGSSIDTEAAVQLNRLRRRLERWTDLLVGSMACLYDVSDFAMDPERASEFADELRQRGSVVGGHRAWSLILASLRAAFQATLCPVSPNPDLNACIASAILSCFPPELFDSIGLLRSPWLMRLTNVADDAQGMIRGLLSDDTPDAEKKSAMASRPFNARSRRFRG